MKGTSLFSLGESFGFFQDDMAEKKEREGIHSRLALFGFPCFFMSCFMSVLVPEESEAIPIRDRMAPFKLPDTIELTGKTISQRAGTRKLVKKRENLLKSSKAKPVREAYEVLKQPQACFKSWSTPTQILEAHRLQKQCAPTVRGFENCAKLAKARKTARIRTQKYKASLGSFQRAWIRGAVDGPSTPIIYHGAAGTGAGSRIGGHDRRGGKWTREIHYGHAPVLLTDEYRTSKTCHVCLGQMVLGRGRTSPEGGVGKGQWRRVHGTLECVNPGCLAYQAGYTVRTRDSQSAMNILLKGAMATFLQCHAALGPFSRSPTSSNYALDSNHLKLLAGNGTDSLPSVGRIHVARE